MDNSLHIPSFTTETEIVNTKAVARTERKAVMHALQFLDDGTIAKVLSIGEQFETGLWASVVSYAYRNAAKLRASVSTGKESQMRRNIGKALRAELKHLLPESVELPTSIGPYVSICAKYLARGEQDKLIAVWNKTGAVPEPVALLPYKFASQDDAEKAAAPSAADALRKAVDTMAKHKWSGIPTGTLTIEQAQFMLDFIGQAVSVYRCKEILDNNPVTSERQAMEAKRAELTGKPVEKVPSFVETALA